MAKFCPNCNTQCEDTASVCGACGTQMEGSVTLTKKFNNKMINMIAAVIAVVAVVVILLVLLLGGGGYKGVVKKYMKAYQKIDAKYIMDVCSEYLVEQAEEYDIDLEDSYKDMLDGLDDAAKDEYGKDYKITYKIKEAETFKGDDLEDELTDINVSDADDYIDDHKVSALVIAELEVFIEGKDGDDESDMTLYIVKENGKWKLLGEEYE